jgi:hypothetical protein
MRTDPKSLSNGVLTGDKVRRERTPEFSGRSSRPELVRSTRLPQDDRGVCGKAGRHRAGLLTFEHQGCHFNERNRSFNNYFRLPVIEE